MDLRPTTRDTERTVTASTDGGVSRGSSGVDVLSTLPVSPPDTPRQWMSSSRMDRGPVPEKVRRAERKGTMCPALVTVVSKPGVSSNPQSGVNCLLLSLGVFLLRTRVQLRFSDTTRISGSRDRSRGPPVPIFVVDYPGPGRVSSPIRPETSVS